MASLAPPMPAAPIAPPPVTGDPRQGVLGLPAGGDPRPAGGPMAAPATTVPPIAPYTPPTVPNPPPPIAPTAPGTFTGPPPNVTPTGTFTAPDANTFTTDPSYQWRLSQGLKAIQGSAAARGTLLSGATEKSLSDYAGGSASQEYGNAYNRALQSYDTNRDTNAQNFGQNQAIYGDTLDAYKTNADTGLNYGRLGLDTQRTGFDEASQTYDQRLNAAKMAQAQQQAQNDRQADVANQAAEAYAQTVAQQRADAAAPGGRRMGAPASYGAAPGAAGGGVARQGYGYGTFAAPETGLNNRYGQLPYPGYSYGV